MQIQSHKWLIQWTKLIFCGPEPLQVESNTTCGPSLKKKLDCRFTPRGQAPSFQFLTLYIKLTQLQCRFGWAFLTPYSQTPGLNILTYASKTAEVPLSHTLSELSCQICELFLQTFAKW